jgi:hypothetical protein
MCCSGGAARSSLVVRAEEEEKSSPPPPSSEGGFDDLLAKGADAWEKSDAKPAVVRAKHTLREGRARAREDVCPSALYPPPPTHTHPAP